VSGVDDLVRWYGAQLDEDERIARGASAEWRELSGNWVVADGNHRVAMVLVAEERAHIVRHDPARVLREIEAKRDLLRLAERAHDYHETFMNGFASALEGTLRLFALAYAGRPGYREEWRP
jgi:hypothetical protein